MWVLLISRTFAPVNISPDPAIVVRVHFFSPIWRMHRTIPLSLHCRQCFRLECWFRWSAPAPATKQKQSIWMQRKTSWIYVALSYLPSIWFWPLWNCCTDRWCILRVPEIWLRCHCSTSPLNYHSNRIDGPHRRSHAWFHDQWWSRCRRSSCIVDDLRRKTFLAKFRPAILWTKRENDVKH